MFLKLTKVTITGWKLQKEKYTFDEKMIKITEMTKYVHMLCMISMYTPK